VVDLIRSDLIDLIVNTPLGRESFFDERAIRRAAISHSVPCNTTQSAARAAASAVRAMRQEKVAVRSLQEYHVSAPTLVAPR
jgi:carbamoyl-phosphate synthase large subunit